MTVSRSTVYGLIIALAAGTALARVMSAQFLYEPNFRMNDPKAIWPDRRPRPMPTFSSNDRSRWATIRALVDHGTYVVGKREHREGGYTDSGIIFEDGWKTVDRVLHPERQEFLSSKPPLMPTILAGLYWLLQAIFGWTLADHPFLVVRTILMIVNVAPFVAYLCVLGRLADRFGATEWGRVTVVIVGAFATLVSPFLITLSNHTTATFCVLFAVACTVRIYEERAKAPWHVFFGAGFFAGFAVVNEMPAASFAGLMVLLLLYWAPGKTLLFTAPLLLVIGAAFLFTNYLAIGQLRPAYSEFGSKWYQYEGSHWRPHVPGEVRRGSIDFARDHESRATYAFHMLLGHHGLFSLTPLWLLAFWGMLKSLRPRSSAAPSQTQVIRLPPFLAPLTLAVSVIVIGFYLVASDNYGGYTVGLRWLMWLTPLWLLCLLPAVDALGTSRAGRWLVYVCLGGSVMSAHYSWWNPWRHPWIFDLMVAWGWPAY
jgi:hypothetical protein